MWLTVSEKATSQVRSPVRTCVGCRKRAAKAELLRVVAEVREGEVHLVPDVKRRASGRGAHLHPSVQCLEQAVRRRAFTRALRVSGGSLVTTALEELVRQRAQADPGTSPDRQ